MGCEIQKSRAKAFDAGQSNEPVIVRPVRSTDAESWLEMRCDLWPEDTAAHREEIDRYFAHPSGRQETVLVAERNHVLAGFVELSLRAYAEGCVTSPVAYLEGWYVTADARGSGVGRALLRAAEEWGRSQGCAEFASDAEAGNTASAEAHRACGFDEVSLIRCFKKSLSTSRPLPSEPQR